MHKYLAISLILLLGYQAQAQIVFGRDKSANSGLSINYSSPKEYEIADISVEGVQFLDNNALISLSGLRVGDKIKIPGEGISSAIKKLWRQGIIGNVEIYANKIEGEQIWLTIRLTERPRLTKYEFEGVNKSQKAELKDKIDLVRGKILTDVVIKNTELSVKKYFEGKGFLNAEVNIRQERDTILANSVNIIINVEKNQKVKVKNINFYGDDNFSQAKLRSKLKNTGEKPRLNLPKDLIEKTLMVLNPKNLFYFLTHRKEVTDLELKEYLAEQVNVNVFKSAKFVRTDFEEDKETLIAFYNSKGYRDAEIVQDSVYSIDRKYLNIDLHVNPGNKYFFRSIEWTGNYIYEDEFLNRVLGIETGDVYDLELVNKKLNYNPTGTDISSLYMDDGYLFFRVNPVEVGTTEDSIDVEMRIYEGPQATINEVTISGNEKTNDHVILREIRTLPGQKFNRSELIRTQRELSQLGYFDPEQVNPVPQPNPVDETVDIEWQLVERPNDQVELSGGWGGRFGFVGTLGLSFNNFSLKNIPHFDKWRPLPMGDGQKLSVRMQANGRRYQSYSLSFNEPWLGGRKPNNFGVSFNHSSQRYITFDNTVLSQLQLSGITVSLGRRVTWPDDFFTVSNSLSLQKYNITGDTYERAYGFQGDSHSFTFNNTIARNSVDNPMYPRGGSSLSISASFTPPYSLLNNKNYDNVDAEDQFKFLEYHKWNLDFKYYLKLVGNLVLAPRAHFGFLGSYSDKVGVGPFERFSLGGDGLTGQNFLLGTDVIGLRGYENRSIRADIENGVDNGTVFTKFVMELRYPVSLNPSATIYFLTFFEGGNNWNDFDEFNPYNLYRSTGVGVRIFMPAFGLLGLDWGYGLDPAPGALEVSGPQFHFSIGQQIR
ncbi:BamA/OMP85 family outer membrane protein [Marinoscillum furvescens]|uniref:Beta-barrel assembly machine subunit BamA n=1 Tax=Marinoscillum furvescens DSM 4134 TaxID=1122208 RepID=A0A3D9L6D1_MARFU|nr:POTRA domain-containing protein [Marinoscillum furvescens]REE01684.1 Beta-barrel assembly machine subunit BamA [Marinoscillum furvescens DSM 4134]